MSEIRAIHAEHDGAYGGPRVHAGLRARGRRNNRKRVTRLMRVGHIRRPAPAEEEGFLLGMMMFIVEAMGKKPRPRRLRLSSCGRRGDRSVGQVAKDFDLTETAVRAG
ncbi:IS3 family transposase [Streptomyces sp. NRRL F-2664]|uniref:IS3 family transposase n=1 Tax=Streptomyces sp. NRRL F-2664 TaxID=1463842 RepID=UPI0007C74BCE